jgi:hypothetical protein
MKLVGKMMRLAHQFSIKIEFIYATNYDANRVSRKAHRTLRILCVYTRIHQYNCYCVYYRQTHIWSCAIQMGCGNVRYSRMYHYISTQIMAAYA